MLTRQEQQQLRQIERAIYATDPHWARLISGGRPSAYERKRRRLNTRLYLLAVALLLTGALTAAPIVIFAGLVATAVATGLHVSRRRRAARPRLAG